MNMDYSIKITDFEGPLDLLLHLIKENNIDIYDISIDEITHQYLDYINKMQELNINVASSYLVMAAELMEIKSKSLLPNQNKEENSDNEEVSKDNLIKKLIEYKKYKEVTKEFKELEELRQEIYIKAPESVNDYITEHFQGDCLLAVGDEELIKIHFHTNEPWKVLEYCASLGEIYDIVVEDMDRQARGLQG